MTIVPIRPAAFFFFVVALAILLLPALYNGFPVVFHDTGAYLDRAFVSRLEPGRGPFYGFFIAATGGRVNLWPVIVMQAAATFWLLALTLRQHGLADGRLVLLAVLLLAATTTMAWGVATVMPDAFAPLAVLAWYLLVFGDRLRPWERAGVAALLLLAALVHITHLELILGLSLCALSAPSWRKAQRHGLALAAAVTLAALALLPLVNGLVSDRFGFTPGGQTFIFGRLVQSGLVQVYLDEHCPSLGPSPVLRLCAYRKTLPVTGDEWIWDSDSPFEALGGWDGFADEMRLITLGSVSEHPWLHLRAAAGAAAEQFIKIGTGEDFDSRYWHTDQQIAEHLPSSLPAFEAGLQHRAQLGWQALWLNRLYVPVTAAALLLLVLVLAIGLWRRRSQPLLLVTLLALIGNAVLCGVLSGPHDRYQGRIAWLAVFAVIVAWAEHRATPPSGVSKP